MIIDEIIKSSYTDFISFLQEENRPSGGKKTIRTIAQNAFVGSQTRVLEIGCTNGFSSLELHRITGCCVTGIDINPKSVDNACIKANAYKLPREKVNFIVASADDLPFEDEMFDLVICGNAMSFIQNKSGAIDEILRVLKPSGFLSMVPIWYNNEPDLKIVRRVSDILGFDILCTRKIDWINFPKVNNLELYFCEDYGFDEQNDETIEKYIEDFFHEKKHINVLPEETKALIRKRWKTIISTFNENLQIASYSVLLMRKNPIKEEAELFTTHRLVL